jgi:hypothetical protein
VDVLEIVVAGGDRYSDAHVHEAEEADSGTTSHDAVLTTLSIL